MMNASQEFKTLLRDGAKLVNYADVTLKDGTVLNLEPSDFVAGGFSMTDKTTVYGKFEIGTAIGKTLNVTIANHTNKFSAYDFYKAIIFMYVAIEKEDGTVLKEKKGKYYVVNPTTPGDTIQLSGVDSMYLFDRPYNYASYPATLQTILAECCTDCGVNIGFGQFANWNFEVENAPQDCTYRQVVSWVVQIAGCYARISNDDYLELVFYTTGGSDNINGGNYFVYENDSIDGGDFSTYESSEVIDGGSFLDYVPPSVLKIKSLSVSTDDVVISGVKVKYDETEELVGSEDYCLTISDNPLVAGREQEVCEYLADRFTGLSFRPLTCQTVNNPLFEPYDSCYVFDRKGNNYFTLINDVSYTISGFTTISCKADDPVRNESSYISESAKAVVEAKRNAQKQLTTYDKAVQNMNLLAANSMGLYRESEIQSDNSIIYYMSNRPITKNSSGTCTFETNSVVYKMTGSGFFVSTNGGRSFTSGFDSKGNAVVNVLSAIGITFDWAKGGTLSLGGLNDVNGVLSLKDANGNEITRLDKNGLKTSKAEITGGSIDVMSSDETSAIINVHDSSGSISTLINAYQFFTKNGDNKASLGFGQCEVTNGQSDEAVMSAIRIHLDNTASSQYMAELSKKTFAMQNKKTGSTTVYSKLIIDTGDTTGSIEFSADSNKQGYFLVNTSTAQMGSYSLGYNINLVGKTTISNGLKVANGSDVSVTGDLTVSGTKSRAVSTENYSDRKLYCYEMSKPYFGDIGEGMTDEQGLCYIALDDIFCETINSDFDYQVFLQKYGQGDLWVEARTPTYFVVKGSENLRFAWEIKAKQKGYEYERLEKVGQTEKYNAVDYESLADVYLENYYKEITNYEENN